MTRAKAAFTGATRVLTVEFAPIIEAVANKMTELSKNSGGFADSIKAGFNNAAIAAGLFADGIRGIEIVFKVVELSAAGLLAGLTALFLDLQRGALIAVNAFREFRGLDPLEGFDVRIEDSLETISTLKGELQTLLTDPLPSEGLQETINEIAMAAEEAAARVATARTNAALAASGQAPVDGEGGEGDVMPLTPEEQLESIAIQNELELQLLKDKQTKELAVIDAAFKKQGITEQTFLAKTTKARIKHNQQSEALEKQHRANLLKTQKFSEIQSVNSFLKTNSDTLHAAASFAKNSFSVTKKLDLASAVVDTAAGVSRALSTANFPLAAAIAIKGAAQIKTIKGQSLGGGGGGGAAVGSAPAAPAGFAPAAQQAAPEATVAQEKSANPNATTLRVELPGEGMFTEEQVRNLLDQISRVQPNFQIETV